ncbi:MAG: TonB-dependent receptor [Alphaproteobacteria bacterium]|nr:TonB-dependent receptor [Alphaproteobacteria bacterium]MBU2083749.1 TonB-dependent receptor [Alphaproteobacteria bacterium]MBU2142535.1 TonB-dependent receptor [Alphaproteobacteria bacterium]MBU2197712.1 TonB-dependent receptor [Alphaproteobacteria bacterium]
MTRKTDSKTVLFAGASVLAIGLLGQAAWAQEGDAPESTRTLATVTVTTQKTEQSIQDVPIAVSAFDEDAINRLQLTGGADLVKAVPNVSFTKGNFTGANFKIRGIGNDAVAQSSDNGVGIHQNDVPIAGAFLLEQEYFDIERVEVLRGPQGTLYGRNATGGVVNIITAKPVFEEFQGNVSLTAGNFNTQKIQGMVNVPIGDKLALRVAGAYTTRDGYVTNTVTGNDIDGRDLRSIRATLGFEPTENFRGWLSYEQFKEDDNRLRSGKELCKKDPTKTSFAGIPITGLDTLVTSLGCVDAPLDQSYEKTNSASTLAGGLAIASGLLNGDVYTSPLDKDLRRIESFNDGLYQAKQDIYTLKLELDLTDSLKVTSLTSKQNTSQYSVQDYNRTVPDVPFNDLSGVPAGVSPLADLYNALFPGGFVTDPELGTSNFLTTFDLSGGQSETFTQEIRMQSSFDGKLNFNLGAIYVDGEAIDPQDPFAGYYVLSNGLTGLTQLNNATGGSIFGGVVPIATSDGTATLFTGVPAKDSGNYFRSLSPYRLESTAFFGEAYYDVTDTLKFTLGLRYTDDQKEQDVVPTALFTPVSQYPAVQNGDPLVPTGLLQADFQETTGRIGLDWSPVLSFTDATLIYGSYSKGYKGGGLNPPQPAGSNLFPATFEPEFVNAFEIGTKNTFANNTQSLNLSAFNYDYEGYQITQIVNRTSANFNVDAKLSGLEIEYLWTPADNWLLTANLGLLKAELKDTTSIDVLDRTAGNPNFVAIKNAASYSNCVVSAQGYATVLGAIQAGVLQNGDSRGLCSGAFAGQEAAFGLGDVTYTDGAGNTQTIGALTPFDGISKDADGNKLPGAPEYTLNLAAEYTFGSIGNSEWDLTIRGDYYLQGESYSRIFNTQRDQLDSWSNVNLAVVLNNDVSGWAVEAFAKNLTDEEVITGAYLTDDSSGLFTNVFLTEPALYGVTLRKSW